MIEITFTLKFKSRIKSELFQIFMNFQERCKS